MSTLQELEPVITRAVSDGWRDHALFDDACQEARIGVWQQQEAGIEVTPGLAWIIAKRRAHDLIVDNRATGDTLAETGKRRRKFEPRDNESLDGAQEALEGEGAVSTTIVRAFAEPDSMDQVDARLDTEKALATLDDRSLALIRGVYFEGRTLTEVAAEVGLSRQNARRHLLERAFPILRTTLGEVES